MEVWQNRTVYLLSSLCLWLAPWLFLYTSTAPLQHLLVFTATSTLFTQTWAIRASLGLSVFWLCPSATAPPLTIHAKSSFIQAVHCYRAAMMWQIPFWALGRWQCIRKINPLLWERPQSGRHTNKVISEHEKSSEPKRQTQEHPEWCRVGFTPGTYSGNVSLRRRHVKRTLEEKKKPALGRLAKRIPDKGNYQCKGPRQEQTWRVLRTEKKLLWPEGRKQGCS